VGSSQFEKVPTAQADDEVAALGVGYGLRRLSMVSSTRRMKRPVRLVARSRRLATSIADGDTA
jgi:hypothetical protein